MKSDRYARYRLSGRAGQPAGLERDAVEDRLGGQWYRARIDKARLKELCRRSDRAGFANFGPWVALLAASGVLAGLSWGTWWAVPAFFLYGTLYTSSDAHWHECAHGTAFRTRWINEAFYHATSFMCLREAYLWRWSHARHHTHTIMAGLDPEIQVPRPARLWPVVIDLFYLYSGLVEARKIALHACGVITADARTFVPAGEIPKMVWTSRAYVAVTAGFAAWSVAVGSFLPMMFVVLPRFYAAWLHQICAMTQHAGLAESVRDHRLNTRTVYMNPVVQFLYANMNFHMEHHMFPMVPFHALPALHEEIKAQMPKAYPGLLGAYREIIPTLIRQVHDPEYFVRRELPQAQP
ncbi:MAG TPA: fatty acid desaturase [Dongiaceae bacterium]|nr:fatty acid desaturase [Dongiaceae bacterium]